jgi:secreted trypsin-like serine protease
VFLRTSTNYVPLFLFYRLLFIKPNFGILILKKIHFRQTAEISTGLYYGSVFWPKLCFILISRQWFESIEGYKHSARFKNLNRGVDMSNNDTGFIKILILVLILGLSHQFSGCAENKSQIYKGDGAEILNGSEVLDTNPISKKVLFLATGAKLLKTPTGGYSASQTGQCTATAIAPKVILTAAHCVKAADPKNDQTPDSLYIILGRKPWKSKFDSKLWYGVEKIIAHSGYKKNTAGGSVDDIAILQLKTALPAESVSELASAKELSSTMIMTLAGYGMRSNVNNLNEANTQMNLGELFSVSKMITNFDVNSLTIEIDQHDQKGICSGDSGGPGLIFNAELKKFVTIGVVSGNRWDVADKDKLDPQNKLDCFGFAVYTNVMNPGYYDWIQKTIQAMK